MYSREEKICIFFAQHEVAAAKFYKLWRSLGSADNFEERFCGSSVAQELFAENFGKICLLLKQGGVEKAVASLQNSGAQAITCFSDAFPQSLADIPDPPYVLFYRGNVKLLESRCIAVVGTRKASSYGRRVATDFVSVLSQHFTVVSGLAYGIDTVAHETALSQHGNTIAVLAGSVVKVYPSANQNLAEKIVQGGGLLVSEYPCHSQPLAYRFPHRNRLVSGLSLGVLVCQSPLKSGTSSTVEHALQQGRDVFAVPGEVYDASFSGNNHLIKSMQGVCVTTPRDIEEYYRLDATESKKQAYQLSFAEQSVVEALSDGQLSFDKLVEKTQISPAELNFLLANLEIKSIIARLPGNTYRLYGGLE